MKLAVVETSHHGGLLHYAVQLGDALAGRGHDVDLLLARDNELMGRERKAHMRAVLTAPARSSATFRSGLRYLLRRAGVGARLTMAWARVVGEVAGGHYDGVIVGADLSLTPAAVGALALTVLPTRPALVFICHNVRPFNRWAGEELYSSARRSRSLLGAIFQRFDLVVVHGERSREEFEAAWPPARLAVVPHGDERIFDELFRGAASFSSTSDPGEERILFFGDWRKVKGLSVLMDAFDELVTRRPSVRLTIAGTPSPVDFDADTVRRWAVRHEGRVALVDYYVPMRDVPALFRRSRVVATPYLTGYQSGVVHLAMTMGRAVVSSDVGDLPSSVLHEKTGLVVPAGDARALADALERVVSQPEYALRLGSEGRRRVRTASSWEAVAERLEAELQASLQLRG